MLVDWSVRSPDEGITPGCRISSYWSSGVSVVGGHVARRDVPTVLLPLLELVAGHVVVVVRGGEAVLRGPVLLRVGRAPSLPGPTGAGAVPHLPHAARHIAGLRLDEAGVGVNIRQDWKYFVKVDLQKF